MQDFVQNYQFALPPKTLEDYFLFDPRLPLVSSVKMVEETNDLPNLQGNGI